MRFDLLAGRIDGVHEVEVIRTSQETQDQSLRVGA
jgi:hypothetical protein